MINLIPNEEKKKMIRSFYFRLLAVSCLMLSFCIFVATASILPSYFISNVRKNLIESKLEQQKNEPILPMDQQALQEINDLKGKMLLIESAEKNKFTLSGNIIKEILSDKMGDIKINQVTFNNDPINGKKITINGTAPSRERLLLFREALEKNSSFKTVDLPISNFIKGSDIRFFLSLTSS